MEVGVYGLPGMYDAVRATFEGIKRLGLTPRYRNPNAWVAHNCHEPWGLVVVAGLKGQCGDILRHYNARGVPVLVLDLGYMRRAYRGGPDPKVYHQLGLNGLNWLPPGPVPSDRLDALHLHVAPQRSTHADAPVYLIGQKADDASHGMDGEALVAWANGVIAELRQHTKRTIIWRPHPHSPHLQVAADAVCTGHLGQALAAAHCVVTYNSNTGHDALMAGAPVLCSPAAPYHKVAPWPLSEVERRPIANTAVRRAYFARLAYGQWCTPELETGEPVAFILRHMLTLAE